MGTVTAQHRTRSCRRRTLTCGHARTCIMEDEKLPPWRHDWCFGKDAERGRIEMRERTGRACQHNRPRLPSPQKHACPTLIYARAYAIPIVTPIFVPGNASSLSVHSIYTLPLRRISVQFSVDHWCVWRRNGPCTCAEYCKLNVSRARTCSH